MKHIMRWMRICAGWMYVAAAHAGAPAELPVRKVALYKHGVGYIERRGTVEDTVEIALRFKPGDMSDMLKSLTVLDLGGGTVRAIAYDSTRTVDQQLDEYSFDLRRADGLPAVLKQLKGSAIALTVDGRVVGGRLLAVESRMEAGSGEQPVTQYYISLLTPDAGVREHNFRDVTEIKFTDSGLRDDLEKYLGTLFERHRRDEKLVIIRADGRGSRELFAAYIQEQPVWKVSYRLVLADAKPALLQAWAIVDNVGVEDWVDVELELVSGLPVSFRQNLYDPFFVQRRTIELQAAVAAGPVMHAAGAPPAPQAFKARKSGEAEVKSTADMAGMGMAESFAPAMVSADLLANMSRQAVAATAQETGALFVYKIAEPVTIRRDRSALLPIVNSSAHAARVSVYNQAVRAENPMDAVRLRNDTGLTLEGGAMTVFDDDTYAGEALMDTLKPGEERHISFAVDLGVRMAARHADAAQSVYSVRIVHGSMIAYHRRKETRHYNARNLTDRPRDLVIEHPRRADWQLTDTPAALEQTDDYYRFAVRLPPGEETIFTVIEESPGQTTYSLNNINSDQIAFFLRQKFIDRRVQAFLEEAAVEQADIRRLHELARALIAERDGIFNNQARLRGNLQALGDSESERGYRSRLVQQLNAEEDRLAQIDREAKDHDAAARRKQDELNRRLMEFTFETKL